MWKGHDSKDPQCQSPGPPQTVLVAEDLATTLHGSVLVAEVQGQSLRVAACDGETALSNTVSLLMFAETSACLVRSLIRALVCALVSPSHVLGVQNRSWKVVTHCHMHTPSFLQLRSAGSYPHSHSF